MAAGQAGASKGLFERGIETAATALGGTIGWMAERGVLFAFFAVLWAAVGLGILFAPAMVSQVWSTIGDQSVIVQGLTWLLLLPVMAGVWVWHTDWPELLRLGLLIAVGGWTLLVLWPRRAAKPAATGSTTG
jgi:hypothetical protein